jgi:hypothetical protein
MPVDIRIATPLPLDVTSKLLKAIGAVYPSTVLVSDSSLSALVLRIDDADRSNPGQEPAPEDVVPMAANVDGWLTSLRDGSLGFGAPEWLSKMLVGALEQILEDTSAQNYLELTLDAPGAGRQYAVVVCRSLGQTPHSLRQAAADRTDRLAARLRDLGEDPDAL